MNKKTIRKIPRTLPRLLPTWYQQLQSICQQIPKNHWKNQVFGGKNQFYPYFLQAPDQSRTTSKGRTFSDRLSRTSQGSEIQKSIIEITDSNNPYRRKAFLHIDGEKSAVLQDVTNETVSDLNRNCKLRFNVNFMSQVTKSTKPSNI